jgi:predicted alpha/beta hydrolase family esterase
MTGNKHFLVLPGWQGSGEDHWQTHWQKALPNTSRLQVTSWVKPDPQEWREALEATLQQLDAPVVLIAHSLGCINLVNWPEQASAELLKKIQAALLVAPADVERPGCPDALQPFAPISRKPLPFPALVLGSKNDPAASAQRVSELANLWQVPYEILGRVGHINTASGHHRWEEGFHWLYELLKQDEHQHQAA